MLSDCCCAGKVGIVAVLLMIEGAIAMKKSAEKSRILTQWTQDSYGREQEIVFPDTISERIDVPAGPPPCAGELTFCETLDNYPYSRIKKVLEQNDTLKLFFTQDEPPIEIMNRIGSEDETFVCSSRKSLVFPKYGETKNNKWKVIINQDDNSNYKQAVQVETCVRPNTECDIPGGVPYGYVMICRQKFLFRKLVSLDGRGEPVKDSFKMPSGCSCAFKHTPDIAARLGKGVTPATPNKTVENSEV